MRQFTYGRGLHREGKIKAWFFAFIYKLSKQEIVYLISSPSDQLLVFFNKYHYEVMNSNVIFFQSIVAFILFDAQIVLLLASCEPFQLDSLLFLMSLIVVITSLLSDRRGCPFLILCIFCPRLRISHLSKEPWSSFSGAVWMIGVPVVSELLTVYGLFQWIY